MSPMTASVAGAMIVGGILLVIAGGRRAPVPASGPQTNSLRNVKRKLALTRSTVLLLAIGLVVGLVVTAWTSWFLATLLIPAMLAGVPLLLAPSPASRRIKQLEALQEWTRSLSGLLGSAVGLEQALLSTERSIPRPIQAEVGRLLSRLRARYSTRDALMGFADDVNDPTGDVIVANLVLSSSRGAAGLSGVLEDLAQSVSAEVAAQRAVEADRAKVRTATRAVSVISLVVLVGFALIGDYMQPYASPIGQVLLGFFLALYAVVLVWLKSMGAGKPPVRFLGATAPMKPGATAPSKAGER